jgi:hypothetical protein
MNRYMIYGLLRHDGTTPASHYGFGPLTSLKSTDGLEINSATNVIKDKMTEDDTFNALKRTPYTQIYAIWLTMTWDQTQLDLDEFYIQHSWTRNEFYDEHHKRQK